MYYTLFFKLFKTKTCLSLLISLFVFIKFNIVAQFTVGDPNNFISVWNSMEAGTITILGEGQGYNYTLYWEDTEDASKYDTIFLIVSNNYTVSGLEPFKNYRIEIVGKFPRLYTNNSSLGLQLRAIHQWGNISWTSMKAAFKGVANVVITAKDTPDLSLVTDMSEMFYGSTNLEGSNANWNWDVSTVTTLKSAFEASEFNEDISFWNVTNMERTFAHTSKFNVPIQTWNVSNVTNMLEMFLYANSFNRPIGSWDVESVTNMVSMFKNATRFNNSLGSWSLKNISDLNFMFENSGMDCVSYSQTLIGWANNPNTPTELWLINLSGIAYSADAVIARAFLTGTKGWTLLDDFLINDPLPNIGSISGPDTLCINATDNFTASEPSGSWVSSVPTVVTIENNGTITAGATAGHTIITYKVTTNGGCSGEVSQDVFVIDSPDVGTIDGPNSIEIEEIAFFEASIENGFWSSDNNDIAIIDYLTGKTIGVAQGTALIIYSVSNFCGTNTVSLPLNVEPKPIETPSYVTDEELLNFSAKVFPNPTADNISIYYEVESPQEIVLHLCDMWGNIIFTKYIIQINTERVIENISIKHIPKGVYTILLHNDNVYKTLKVIKL